MSNWLETRFPTEADCAKWCEQCKTCGVCDCETRHHLDYAFAGLGDRTTEKDRELLAGDVCPERRV